MNCFITLRVPSSGQEIFLGGNYDFKLGFDEVTEPGFYVNSSKGYKYGLFMVVTIINDSITCIF